jgi:FkbM family methyltransferase
MTLETLLSELLLEPPDAAEARAAAAFDRIAAPFENRIVVFGAGHLGRLAASGLRAAGIAPLAFCDNSPRLWGTSVDGTPVLSPAAGAGRYKNSAAFVTAIYNPSAIRNQLRELGCPRIVPYLVLFWKHWRSMPGEDRLELPHRILARAGEMAAGYELLSDRRSRAEFCAQIRWRCLLDYDCLPMPDEPGATYFPADLFGLLPDEVFVDCGAFDGDTIRPFLRLAEGRFRRVFAVEADPANIQALERYCSGLPPETARRISILPHAIGQTDGMVRFSAAGFVGSKVMEAGAGLTVQCKKLDTALAESCPTFIKMDIEGAEPDALLGAAGIMARCRPIMAVCAYHKCDHLWALPQLLRAGNPDYRIFLRRYAEECWETVYYGIPPERLIHEPRM